MIKQTFIIFDGMTWPLPDDNLVWELTWGKPTKDDLIKAATRLDAYKALINKPQEDREDIIRKIKRVIRGVM